MKIVADDADYTFCHVKGVLIDVGLAGLMKLGRIT
jgi:hypothetical protein